jgi:predicted adenylyl cyclase CyaB
MVVGLSSRTDATTYIKLVNFEFKARLRNEKHIQAVLKERRAKFVGTDQQVDTYFCVPRGRLKVREGNIENALIFYERPNAQGARASKVQMLELPPENPVKSILSNALGVLAVVNKRREIYFVDNVKIHLDHVHSLGEFVEVEAISRTASLDQVRAQAHEFECLFQIAPQDFIGESYSDLMLAKDARDKQAPS